MRAQPLFQLKKMGLKVTPQRLAILKLLDGNRFHPSADSIYAEVSREFPGISFATVYNTLSKLAQAGRIQELDVDPKKKRFDPCMDLHNHLFCTECGRVFDIASEAFPLQNVNSINAKRLDGH